MCSSNQMLYLLQNYKILFFNLFFKKIMQSQKQKDLETVSFCVIFLFLFLLFSETQNHVFEGEPSTSLCFQQVIRNTGHSDQCALRIDLPKPSEKVFFFRFLTFSWFIF